MFGTNIHLQNMMSSIRAKETELKSTIECLMDALQSAETHSKIAETMSKATVDTAVLEMRGNAPQSWSTLWRELRTDITLRLHIYTLFLLTLRLHTYILTTCNR